MGGSGAALLSLLAFQELIDSLGDHVLEFRSGPLRADVLPEGVVRIVIDPHCRCRSPLFLGLALHRFVLPRHGRLSLPSRNIDGCGKIRKWIFPLDGGLADM